MKLFPKTITALCFAGSMAFLPPALAQNGSAPIKERQAKILDVVNNSSKAVVGIDGIGSGVIVSKDGMILTAAHVMDAMKQMMAFQKETEFDVTLADGREVRAKPLGCDRNRDAALAKITTPGEYPFAEMASTDTIKQGAWCVGMGHPGGYQVDRTAPVRAGRLWKKDDDAYYRSDCVVSGGDSGGPLFDLEGRVIGIHSSIGVRLDENRHVPVGAFKDSWERMEKGESWGEISKLMPELKPFDRLRDRQNQGDDGNPQPERRNRRERRDEGRVQQQPKAFLGASMERNGADIEVTNVAADSPAEAAGLKVSDRIHKIDGKDVKTTEDVVNLLGERKPGDAVKLSISRGDAPQDIEVKLGTK